jgi:hypothetical protein
MNSAAVSRAAVNCARLIERGGLPANQLGFPGETQPIFLEKLRLD